MRIKFPFLILCLGVSVSFSKPLEDETSGDSGGRSGKHANAKVIYREKIKSNTSSVETVMVFSNLDETQLETIKGPSKTINATTTTTTSNPKSDSISFNKTEDIPETISEHLERLDERSKLTNNEEGEEKTLFHFRGPGVGKPPPPLPPSTPIPTMTEEDQKAREDWGGNCLSEDWKRCSHIDGWGGNYYVKDKRNPGKFILKTDGKIPCGSNSRTKEKETVYCLWNGYSVARCHMLCISSCNKDYLIDYDKLVQHEGKCANPLERDRG